MNKGPSSRRLTFLLANVKQRKVCELQPSHTQNAKKVLLGVWVQRLWRGLPLWLSSVPLQSTPQAWESGTMAGSPWWGWFLHSRVHSIGRSFASVYSGVRCFVWPPKILPQLPGSLLPSTLLSSLSTCAEQGLFQSYVWSWMLLPLVILPYPYFFNLVGLIYFT